MTAALSWSPRQVLGFCGSLRRGSFNLALLHAAQELAPSSMRISVYDIRSLPFFFPEAADEGEPESVKALKDAIAGADALLIATPEYNAGIPGVLKNAIDWASQPPERSVLCGKPAAILGCTTGSGGTVRAQMQLRQTLQYSGVQTLLQPELLVSRAPDRFDATGRLTDPATRSALTRLLLELCQWARRLHGLESPRAPDHATVIDSKRCAWAGFARSSTHSNG